MAPDGVPAIGMKYDPRSNLLFVACGGSGRATVFDAELGDVVASCQLQDAPTFINDVVVTREAAYFTDSQTPFLYRVALGPAGEPAADAIPMPLPGTFRTNGILSTTNGEHLFVVAGPTRSSTGSTRPHTRRFSSNWAEARYPTRTDCCSTARRCTQSRTSGTGSPS